MHLPALDVVFGLTPGRVVERTTLSAGDRPYDRFVRVLAASVARLHNVQHGNESCYE
jgi:hypothetical protein